MDYRSTPYRDSQRRDHWPDAGVDSYTDYALNWSRLLHNRDGERFASIDSVQWFLPEGMQGNKINTQEDIAVIWLRPTAKGVYAVRCKMTDTQMRIHYKTMYLTVRDI